MSIKCVKPTKRTEAHFCSNQCQTNIFQLIIFCLSNTSNPFKILQLQITLKQTAQFKKSQLCKTNEMQKIMTSANCKHFGPNYKQSSLLWWTSKLSISFFPFAFFFFSMMIINSMPKPPSQALKKKIHFIKQ